MRPFSIETKDEGSPRTILFWSIMASALVIGFLLWLIYLKQTPGSSSSGVVSTESVLPALNALLNALSACSLLLGFIFIRKGQINIHRRFMLGALFFSALFLISYIAYHSTHGDTPFRGTGVVRPIYFFILISHILLTVIALPVILTTLFLALTGRFKAHRRIARITLPAWLYVSVTGVVIFFMLRFFN
jgi:putative membrane protein